MVGDVDVHSMLSGMTPSDLIEASAISTELCAQVQDFLATLRKGLDDVDNTSTVRRIRREIHDNNRKFQDS
jgi:hypothetical protein